MISDLNGEKIAGSLKQKVINCTLNWKGYDNSFNNWIDKKDIV